MRETLGVAHANVTRAGLDEGIRACNSYVGKSAKVWSMHYEASRTAAYRVCSSIELDTSVSPLTMQLLNVPHLRLGGLLWEFRSRAVTTAKFSLCFEDDVPLNAASVKVASMTRVVCVELDFHRQWSALIGNLSRVQGLPVRAVQMIKKANLSTWFDNPMQVFKSNDWVKEKDVLSERPYRYVVEPFALWTDLAQYLEDQARDCAVLMSKSLEVEDLEQEEVKADTTLEGATTKDMRPGFANMLESQAVAYTGFHAAADAPPGFRDTLEYLEDEIDEALLDELMCSTYEDYDDFERAVNALLYDHDTYDNDNALEEANPLG
jgi:hypothetical protein